MLISAICEIISFVLQKAQKESLTFLFVIFFVDSCVIVSIN